MITVIVRTRDEASNIDRFCQSYHWADKILIADGGSLDDTVKRALSYPNVEVREFAQRIYKNGLWRNPHAEHINFLIDWTDKPDWVIFDDCDCVPTLDLQKCFRDISNTTRDDIIMLYRLYVWGDSQYFPKLNEPGQSLYAWRGNIDIRAIDNNLWGSHEIFIPDIPTLKLGLPLTCLHYYCPDEQTVLNKMEFYGKEMEHPLKSSGPLEQLPKWARWK